MPTKTDALLREIAAITASDSFYAQCLRLTKNPADAEDLVQETFLRAARAVDRLRDGGNPRAWLTVIARNRANSLRRQRAVRSSRRPDVCIGAASAFMASRDLDEALTNADRISLAEAAIAAHSSEWLTVLHAQAADVTLKDIAAELGVSHGTAMSRAYRGREIAADHDLCAGGVS